MNTSKNKIKSLMLALVLSVAAISTASARVCFLPDSTDCGEGDVVGSSNVDVPCQYSNCPAYNTNYQTCYTERIYNNGGVNVECKQVKCSLSKSDCEKKEADPNSSQCCNFDRDSGCYYMGSCKLCNRDVYDSEKNLGEGYNCYPCKDKNGTFYNCTAIEKECQDINSKYTSSCSDSQTAEEVKGVKDSHGNQCYTCKDKPIGCTYEYRQATTADSCGLRDFENTTKCMDSINGCQCYTQLIKVSSLSAGAGTVTPINKISNKSATCVDENNVTKYQTICEGTAKSYCDTSNGYEFTPNGCVSDTYNNGFEVKGDEFGSCIKKEEKCDYKYAHLTRDEISGVNSDNTTFGINSGLYSNIQSHRGNTEGIYPYSVGEYTNKAANRIDKTSKTCTRPDGTTVYEKVCEGTIKAACKEKFESNGCFSSSYQVTLYYDGSFHGLNVEAAEFGYCRCDSDKGLFGTEKACTETKQLKCYSVGKCYQTCEAGGMYSTKEKCEEGLPGDSQCVASSTCYARHRFGWGIHYSHNSEKYDYRNYNCGSTSGSSVRTTVGWDAFVAKENTRIPADDINGIVTALYKDNPHTAFYIRDYSDEVRFKAGKYSICVSSDYERVMVLNSIYLTSGSSEQCNYTWNSKSNRWEVSSSANYCKGLLDMGDNHTCITANFEDGEEYYIGASLKVTDNYKCCARKYNSSCNP